MTPAAPAPAAPLPDVGPEFCDIVMKGGVTSGVVYPLAVVELGRRFRFRNVGGTSAGAVAAAAAAAAEYGRDLPGAGFERLARLPSWLGADGHLLGLFQPQHETRALLEIALAAIGHEPMRTRALRVVGTALGWFFGWAALGAAPGLWLALQSLRAERGVDAVVALVVAASGALVLTAVGVARRVATALPANAYGLARGYDEREPDGRPGLARWLDAELDALAGREGSAWPLTFRHLWLGREAGARHDDAMRAAPELAPPDEGAPSESRRVNLEMITSNLTHGRPYGLPFEARTFWFDGAEMRGYFPERVVAWMERRAPACGWLDDGGVRRRVHRLPAAGDLPVVVAARLSLSFPLLISAVPLYAIDFGRARLARRGLERCWFSDGGITSNFPVHFFDSPLPGWPTFAINLRYFEEKPSREVVMPETNRDGVAERFHRFEKAGLLGFVRAIFDAMQNWQDNTQVRMPGFRDRVAHVCLGPGEGGLNLEMPEAVVKTIAARGAQAGEMLAQRFAPGSPAALNWDNHRWVRLRSMLASLEEMLEKLGPRLSPDWKPPQPGDEPYAALLAKEAPPSFPWKEGQRAEAARAVEEIRTTALRWVESPERLRRGAPRPMPELRARPKV